MSTDQKDPIADPAVLAQLSEDVGADLLPRVLTTFIGELEKAEGHLREAVAAGDLPAILRICHSLCSSSLNLGAIRIGRMAESAELAGHEGDQAAVMARSQAVLALFAETISTYRALTS